MKKTLALLLALLLTFFCTLSHAGTLSPEREASLSSIRKLTSYEELNLYSMDILYDYSLDSLTPVGVYDSQALVDLMVEEALPGMQLDIAAPDFGCSAFTFTDESGDVYMGRNYDFRWDSSAMIVRCQPKNGYASAAHCALDNLGANDALSSEDTRLRCLISPFLCLDGINEKGVGIAVLTLDSEPTLQNTGKPVLNTGVLIRLVLDQAASTQEAVELISRYDVYAMAGRDYHFYIADRSGDARVIEFDCDDPARPLLATSAPAVTNFFYCYRDRVEPNQKNGVYGHGKERYLSILDIMERSGGKGGADTVLQALRAASQLPNPESVTSNTQWSVAYNLTRLSYDFVLHRDWEQVCSFTLFED